MTLPTAIAAVTAASVAQQRETMRKWLALTVIGLVSVLALMITQFVWSKSDLEGAQLLLTGLFTPVIGIAGTVLGFYFGAQEKP